MNTKRIETKHIMTKRKRRQTQNDKNYKEAIHIMTKRIKRKNVYGIETKRRTRRRIKS